MLRKKLRDLYACRYLIRDMALKQFRAKYAGLRLGLWWAVVTPLLLAASINFVFTIVFNINMPGYALFVLAGIMPWFFFTGSLTEATQAIVTNAQLLRQSRFSREILPIAYILANLLSFFAGISLLLPLFVFFNPKLLMLIPLLFFAILLHTIFIIGLGLIFALVNVFLRDLSYFLSLGFMIWFWVTPVFYSIDMVPPSYRWIPFYNPMTYYIIFYQDILFRAKAPDIGLILASLAISFLFLIVGYAVFIKKEQYLLKNL